jgi:dTDP-glucose 4,6-dehydratase
VRHVIIGGDGFTGRWLARDVVADGEEVLVADLQQSNLPIYRDVAFQAMDITDPASVAALPIGPDDVIYNLAARQYHLAVPRRDREAFFDAVNFRGTGHLLDHMAARDCHRLVSFSTDMVYGFPQRLPVDTNHPCLPLGPYGGSKLKSETLCRKYRDGKFREGGMNITILRPRLIIGPGRLGVLAKLFRLIERGLPVPMIGNGRNHYQMVSVFDCVSAARCAVAKGLPNGEYNLGSDNPPPVRALLQALIDEAGSRSVLLPTPGSLVKLVLGGLDRIGLPLLYREQYAIADEEYLVDIEATKQALGWQPQYRDDDMIRQAFREFRRQPAEAVDDTDAGRTPVSHRRVG